MARNQDKEGHITSNRNELQLPAKYTEYEIEHEKRSDDDERNKIHPVVRAAQGIVGLQSIRMSVSVQMIIIIIIIIIIKLMKVDA